jgi:hypothetical protein
MRDDRALPPVREDRMMPPPPMREDRMMPPMRDDRPLAPPPPMPPPMRPQPPMPAPTGGGFGRFDDPRYDEPTGTFAGGSFDGFEPGRHGKMDMTTEIRMPSDLGPPPGAPMSGGMGGGMGGGELHRIDQLRRTFVPRRFGSGYDPAQVDRLFEGILAAMSGRGGMAINDAELDPGQFNLVPGGYFEAEVDQALREVRDIILRRR